MMRNPRSTNCWGGIRSTRQFADFEEVFNSLKNYVDRLIDRVVEPFHSVVLGLELLGSDLDVYAEKV